MICLADHGLVRYKAVMAAQSIPDQDIQWPEKGIRCTSLFGFVHSL